MNRRFRWLALGAGAGVLVAVVAIVAAGRRQQPSVARSVAPAPSAATANASRPVGPARLYLSEYRGTETTLVSVAAADPTDRRRVLRVEHARNWAPRFAIGPRDGLIAYTALPPDAVAPDIEAVLWLADPREKEAKRLAAAVDVRAAPRWSPDGARLAYGRTLVGGPNGVEQIIEAVETRDGKAQTLAKVTNEERLTPVGYRDPNRFVYVRFERGGAYLHEVAEAGRAVRLIGRIAPGAARDFTLAPDGKSLAFLLLEGTPPRYRARTVDLDSGDVRPLLEAVSRTEDVGVVWHPATTGGWTVGMVTPGREHGGLLSDTSDGFAIASATGFDVPVAWSPDGRRLVARSFTGTDSDNPGRERLTLLDREGTRQPLSGDAPLAIVGWGADGP